MVWRILEKVETEILDKPAVVLLVLVLASPSSGLPRCRLKVFRCSLRTILRLREWANVEAVVVDVGEETKEEKPEVLW